MSDLLSGFPLVRYVAPLMDVSGYGEASRHHALSLIDHGAQVWIDNVVLSVGMNPGRATDPLHARVGGILNRQTACPAAPPISVYHLPPTAYPQYRGGRPGLHVAATLWETTRFPREWVTLLNREFDQVWCASEWQAGVFRDSGVKAPLAVVPYGLDEKWYPTDGPELPGVRSNPEETVFYCIFQWTSRKNPEGIIRAYLDAFTGDDNVVLVIKSYRDYNRFDEAQKQIEGWVGEIVRGLRRRNPPRIKVIGRQLSREEILALHRAGDVYMGLSRGEGWFFPAHEAMLMGNPAILTNWSAQTEFASPTSAYMVDWQPSKVEGMPWFEWYRPDQRWAEPDVAQAAAYMRRAADDKADRLKMGAAAREAALRFSPEHAARCARSALQFLTGGST